MFLLLVCHSGWGSLWLVRRGLANPARLQSVWVSRFLFDPGVAFQAVEKTKELLQGLKPDS